MRLINRRTQSVLGFWLMSAGACSEPSSFTSIYNVPSYGCKRSDDLQDVTLSDGVDNTAIYHAKIDHRPYCRNHENTPILPAFTKILPPSGPSSSATSVEINGKNFVKDSQLWVDGIAVAEFQVQSSTKIMASIPAQPGKMGFATIQVRNPDGSSATGYKLFSYTATELSFSVKRVTSGYPLVSFAIGNFHHSNKLDIAIVHDSRSALAILENDGEGGVLRPQYFPINNYGALTVEAADLNLDGKLDLVATGNGPDAVITVLGDESGRVKAPHAFAAGNGPRGIAIADYNGDVIPDIAISNTWSENLSILLGDGAGNFNSDFSVPVGKMPANIATADLNGDGLADIVVANAGSDTVSVLLGQHGALPSLAATYPVGKAPEGIIAADINRDGRVDLVVSNLIDNTVSVLLGDGFGRLAPARNFPTGTAPLSLAAGDLNGDSIPDLVISNYKADSISVILGNRTELLYNPQVEVAVDGSPSTVRLGDFNGDKKLDIAVACIDSAWVTMLFNQSR